MYPCIHINLDKIAENVRVMKDLTEKHHIEITGVTKVFGGEERIAQTLVNQGIKRLEIPELKISEIMKICLVKSG